MNIAIGPDTRVGAMLEAFPALEEVLAGLSPAFAKLRNPIMRRTVAKVATLEQAAKVGGVSLPEMIRALRLAAGQDAGQSPAPVPEAAEQDGWLADAVVAEDIDADRMLERGVHPVGKVKEGATAIPPGQAVRLASSFRPQPLIEMMRQSGYAVLSREISPGLHRTWFGRKP